ncbi:hypothetical protein FGO68_gene2426 [Halteria grandinella]|uniref:Chloride channel protein n=1 Tax=Halteria grandinella TaxID=5974 RepID=A0A8J8SWH4_HALGN|nr:hypothetical protein FGO68_gene2426 [Halteria grandinella]
MLAMCSPIPGGLLSPSFILGAVFGRLYGYILRHIGLFFGLQLITYEGLYAIVGAAAFASGVTRTLSIAMIIFEIIGNTSHMIPILIGVLLSYAVSSSLSLSAFDALIEIKNLPFLPTLTGYSTYHLNAKDLMNKNFLYLTKHASSLGDIATIIAKVGHTAYTVPVVDSDYKKILLFTVQSQQLKKFLNRKYQKVLTKLDPEVQILLRQYLESLNRFRLGEEIMETCQRLVEVGLSGETEMLEPFIAFVNNKDFQIAQLYSIHRQESKDKDDLEQITINSKLERQQVQLDNFWNMAIDFDDEDAETCIMKDIAPFIVLEDTAVSKLHFLFIMLNIAQVNIISQGAIVGIITKLEFLKKRKEEAQLMKKERRRLRIVNTLSAGAHAFAHLGTALRLNSGQTPAVGGPAHKKHRPSFSAATDEHKEQLLEPVKQK